MDGMNDEGMPMNIKQVEVIIKASVAEYKGYTVISDRVHIVDIPGIEDA